MPHVHNRPFTNSIDGVSAFYERYPHDTVSNIQRSSNQGPWTREKHQQFDRYFGVAVGRSVRPGLIAASERSRYLPAIAYRPTDTLRSFFRPAAARSYFLKMRRIRPPTPRPSPEWRRQFRARLRRSRRGRFMNPKFKKRRRKRK